MMYMMSCYSEPKGSGGEGILGKLRFPLSLLTQTFLTSVLWKVHVASKACSGTLRQALLARDYFVASFLRMTFNYPVHLD
jgi:hypothetical protein